jgi:hypothetical protein
MAMSFRPASAAIGKTPGQAARRSGLCAHGFAQGGAGMRRLVRWIGERIPVDQEVVRKGLREPLPVHMKSWIFCLGGTPAMLFCILAVTGILLTFYYVPYPSLT